MNSQEALGIVNLLPMAAVILLGVIIVMALADSFFTVEQGTA